MQRNDSLTHAERKFTDIVLWDTLSYLEKIGIPRNSGFQNVITGMCGIIKLSTEFGLLQDKVYDYLFPFRDVKKAAKLWFMGQVR